MAVLFPLLTTLGSEFDNQPKFLIYLVNLINFYNSENIALKITLIFSISAILGSLFRIISLIIVVEFPKIESISLIRLTILH